jgi:hypothetical protein
MWQARQCEHARQHGLINGKWVGYGCDIKDVSRAKNSEEVKSAGSAGKTKGKLMFDFLLFVSGPGYFICAVQRFVRPGPK